MKEVHWKSILTGYTGHGDSLPDDVAETTAKVMNVVVSEVYHWTVRVIEAIK